MPKLIDYPRTNYTGAWEVAEIVDDTGGKCALETCARKLNRKVSGSFKAIVGSAVKFGLLTSKRETLATTTLFRRIKHAYDKQEELLFHREAFLTPPLFTQLCRKFRSRELPVAMLDVLLMREFSVEEINAQAVAKAFIDGARMVNLLDEHNLIADIDQLSAQQPPRRELASPLPPPNVFRQQPHPTIPIGDDTDTAQDTLSNNTSGITDDTPISNPERLTAPVPSRSSENILPLPPSRPAPTATSDAIATLFGLSTAKELPGTLTTAAPMLGLPTLQPTLTPQPLSVPQVQPSLDAATPSPMVFRIQLSGPGINTELDVEEVEDLALIRGLLNKIERQLRK